MTAAGSSARTLGHPRLHLRAVGSTNERAKALAAAGAPHGTLVTADEQTAGRGRQGRSWHAPPGRALLASILVRGLTDTAAPVPLTAAVAVCEACEALGSGPCAIKWPNDVWIERRKVAGILVEARPGEGWTVIGMGLNVSTAREEFPPEVREFATSLRISAGLDVTPTEALEALLCAFERRLADPSEALLEAWGARDALRGVAVRWAEGEGTAAGVSSTGALLVDTAEGRTLLDAGEVHLS
jgi:BirA family biotin operon repressor/biotin-[acetyl-CoA-carboxylase] ligase